MSGLEVFEEELGDLLTACRESQEEGHSRSPTLMLEKKSLSDRNCNPLQNLEEEDWDTLQWAQT